METSEKKPSSSASTVETGLTPLGFIFQNRVIIGHVLNLKILFLVNGWQIIRKDDDFDTVDGKAAKPSLVDSVKEKIMKDKPELALKEVKKFHLKNTKPVKNTDHDHRIDDDDDVIVEESQALEEADLFGADSPTLELNF